MREGERGRERETDRQTDRQIDRDRARETERLRGREMFVQKPVPPSIHLPPTPTPKKKILACKKTATITGPMH